MAKKFLKLAATYTVDDSYDSDKFLKLRIRVMHDGANVNGSRFAVESMRDAEESIKNVPILANVVFDADGKPDFGAHDRVVVKDAMNDSQYRIIYKEAPVGVIPEQNNYAIEEFDDRNYVYVDGYIWRGYSNYAADLLEENGGTDISMEIEVDECEFSEADKVLDITKWRYTGITLLGKKYKPGMAKAAAKTSKFTASERDEQLMRMLLDFQEDFNRVYVALDKEGEDSMAKQKFDEASETEKVLTAEETAAPATETTEETPETIELEETPAAETEEVPAEETPDTEMAAEDNFAQSVPGQYVATHNQMRDALCNALDPIIERDSDGNVISATHFWIQDFDNQYVYVERYHWGDDGDDTKHGRFAYTFSQETLKATLTSEFEEMVVKWLTLEEARSIDEARSNYSELVELRQYRCNHESDAILSEFSDLEGNEAFEALKADHAKFSSDELRRECFVIRGMSVVVAKPQEEDKPIRFAVFNKSGETTSEKPYNGVFQKFGIDKK